MKLIFSAKAWEDYLHWQTADPEGKHQRINELIKQTMRTPLKGIGKPERLKHELSGWLSLRITKEHRMVYKVSGKGDDKALELFRLRGHY